MVSNKRKSTTGNILGNYEEDYALEDLGILKTVGAMWLLFTVLTATASGQSMEVTNTTHLDGVVTGNTTHLDGVVTGNTTHLDGVVTGNTTHLDGVVTGNTTHLDGVVTGYDPFIKYGGVVIIGGVGATVTSETLGTAELPSFPGVVWVNTVSIVGSTVFSCGGLQEEYTSACYYLGAEDQTWRSIALPWPLTYHSAVAVQDKTIWFLQGSMLYSYDTAKDNDQFREYRLSVGHLTQVCVVTNQSHTFIIGAGGSKDEVWVNRDPSKPTEWEKVANLLGGRHDHACLWFGSDIFVTGGARGRVTLDSVEVLNVADMTIRSTRPSVGKRVAHEMAVLHGKPAVLGGSGEGAVIASIEVYDVKNDTWQTLNYTMKEPRHYFGLAQYRP